MAESGAFIVNLDGLLSKYHKAEISIIDEILTPLHKPTHLKLTAVVLRDSSREAEQFVYFAKLCEEDSNVTIRVDLLVRFIKEIEFYGYTLPYIREFQIGQNVLMMPYDKLFPTCIGARLSAEDNNLPDYTGVLVLENLTVTGYKSPDIKKGLDLETCQIVLLRMAQMHATPLAIRILNLDLFREKIVPCLIDVKYAKEPFCYQDVDRLINKGLDLGDLINPYLKPVKAFVEQAKRDAWRGKSYEDEDWLTLCHSKFSLFNIMLQYDDDNRPESCKIFDLQALEYGHCCDDLIYFLFTSVNTSVLMRHFDFLVKWYYDSFVETLAEYKIHQRCYTPQRFHEELNNQGPKMFLEIVQTLPYISCDGREADGDPILGDLFKKKLEDVVFMMINRHWINV